MSDYDDDDVDDDDEEEASHSSSPSSIPQSLFGRLMAPPVSAKQSTTVRDSSSRYAQPPLVPQSASSQPMKVAGAMPQLMAQPSFLQSCQHPSSATAFSYGMPVQPLQPEDINVNEVYMSDYDDDDVNWTV